MNLKYFKISTWSEHIALQNVACIQPIGFIFPIHWSELSTSLKATLRVSDLSFGSLSEQINKDKKICEQTKSIRTLIL